jgi:hypothetical protein
MSIDQDRVSRALSFTLATGTEIFPVRMRRNDTGGVAFRVSKRGNTVDDSLEVDETKMLELVSNRGYSVRCSSLDGTVVGLYKIGGRSVRSVNRA